MAVATRPPVPRGAYLAFAPRLVTSAPAAKILMKKPTKIRVLFVFLGPARA